jgi:chromosome segregation ATPase
LIQQPQPTDKHPVSLELGKNFLVFFIGIFATGVAILSVVGVSKHPDTIGKLAGFSGGSSLISAMVKDFLKSRREQQQFIEGRRQEVDNQFRKVEDSFKSETQDLWLALKTHQNSPGHEKLMERVSVLERLVARLKGQVAAFSQSGKMLDEIRGIKEQNTTEVNMLKTQHQELMTKLEDIGSRYETRIQELEAELTNLRENLDKAV